LPNKKGEEVKAEEAKDVEAKEERII